MKDQQYYDIQAARLTQAGEQRAKALVGIERNDEVALYHNTLYWSVFLNDVLVLIDSNEATAREMYQRLCDALD